MKFDDMLYGMTTLIEAKIGEYKSQGSGFFYNILSPKDPSVIEGGQWRNIEGMWLVTNRHVALPKIDDHEMIPDIFTFNLRQVINGKVEWLPISLSKMDYLKRLKVHRDPEIDVAVINVCDLITPQMASKITLINSVGLTNDNLPENSVLPINVGDDILVAGYPRGFYDTVNKFPIVKSGIISTKWGSNFDDNPYFLIDAKLFPGSSGSVVLTKPQHLAIIDEQLQYNKDGEYIFLGVFSGEPCLEYNPIEFEGMTIIKKETYNVGTVWYSSLVPEIISNGVKIQPN